VLFKKLFENLDARAQQSEKNKYYFAPKEWIELKKISSMFVVNKSTVSRINKANDIRTTNKPGSFQLGIRNRVSKKLSQESQKPQLKSQNN
jgi:hypothetical protein